MQLLLSHVRAHDVGVALNVVLEDRFSFHEVNVQVTHSLLLALHSCVVSTIHVAKHSVGVVGGVLRNRLTQCGTHGGAVSLTRVETSAPFIRIKDLFCETGSYTIVASSIRRSS